MSGFFGFPAGTGTWSHAIDSGTDGSMIKRSCGQRSYRVSNSLHQQAGQAYEYIHTCTLRPLAAKADKTIVDFVHATSDALSTGPVSTR